MADSLINFMMELNRAKCGEIASLSHERFGEAQHHSNYAAQKAWKNIHDVYSTINKTGISTKDLQNEYDKLGLINQCETKSVPSKCFHYTERFKWSSKMFIKWFWTGLTNIKLLMKHRVLFSKLMSRGIDTVCIQCISEFVIQTNKFQLLIEFLQTIIRNKVSSTNVYTIHVIISMLNMALTQKQIVRLFCKKKYRYYNYIENIEISDRQQSN
eukprot:240539_1